MPPGAALSHRGAELLEAYQPLPPHRGSPEAPPRQPPTFYYWPSSSQVSLLHSFLTLLGITSLVSGAVLQKLK